MNNLPQPSSSGWFLSGVSPGLFIQRKGVNPVGVLTGGVRKQPVFLFNPETLQRAA